MQIDSKKGNILSIVVSCVIVVAVIFVVRNHGVKISGMVVPHHDLVSAQRKVLFEDLAKQLKGKTPDTIILVSPNHYLAGQGRAQTTDKLWQLPDGQIQSNSAVVEALVKSRVATKEPSSFEGEHGIYNILEDIHQTFPQAKLVPIILKEQPLDNIQKINEVLATTCENCLMIASVDFSHYQPELIANLHDEKTIRDLQNLDYEDVSKNAEVDSGQSLALLMLWAKSNGTFGFNLKNHTNSNSLLKTPDAEGTSHVYGWYSNKPQEKPEEFISFVISPRDKVGEENRAIWGTDLVLKPDMSEGVDWQFNDRFIAGKITKTGLEYFMLPFDPNNVTKLITTNSEQSAGKMVKIDQRFDLKALTSKDINNTIKTIINQNNGK